MGALLLLLFLSLLLLLLLSLLLLVLELAGNVDVDVSNNVGCCTRGAGIGEVDLLLLVSPLLLLVLRIVSLLGFGVIWALVVLLILGGAKEKLNGMEDG